MAFTRKTNSIPLFSSSGDYHAEAKLSYSKNENNRTFTVTVEGVAAYCKYGWNFRSNMTIWLANSSNGNGKVSNTGTIANSGSNSYKGWLPKSGYANITVSKTFNYNDDGSVPTVYFYLNAYNSSVKWISAGKSTPVNVTYSGNISSEIPSIGPKDVDPPTVTSSYNGADSSAIYWTAKSNVKCSEWQYRVDSGAWRVFGAAGNSASGGVNVRPGKHYVEICGKKASNGKWGYAKTLSYDTTLPSISSQSITVNGSNKGVLNFTSNYKCDYILTASGYSSGWIKGQAANSNPKKSISLVNNKELNYTLTVRRSDNTSLSSSVNIGVDSRIPNISELYFTPDSVSSGYLYIKSAYSYKWRYKIEGKSWSSWSGTVSSNVADKRYISLTTNRNTTVSVEVIRSINSSLGNSTSTVVDLRIPTINSLKLNVTGNGTAKLQFASNLPFKYRYFNGKWSSWSTNYSANATVSTNISVTKNSKTDVKVEVMRTSSSYLTTSSTIASDSRLPSISKASIVVKSAKTGVLNYSSNFDTIFEITTVKKYSDSLKNGLLLSKNIDIHNNTQSEYILTVRRKDNTSLSNSVTIYTDSRLPNIKEVKFVPNSISSGKLYLNSSYSYQYRYKTTSGWSQWSNTVSANTSSGVVINLPSNATTNVSIQVRRSSNTQLYSTKDYSCDLLIPDIKNDTVKVTSNGKATLSFTSSYSFNYRYYNGIAWSSWSTNYNANYTVSLNINVPKDKDTNVIVQIRRSYSNYLSNQTTKDRLVADSRLPDIINPKITVNTYTSGTLSYESDFDTDYTITTTKNYNGNLTKDKILNKSIELPEDKNTSYTLTVRRRKNPSLYSTTKVDIDTRKPTLVSKSIEITDFDKGILKVIPTYDSYFLVNGVEYDCEANKTLTINEVSLYNDTEDGNLTFVVKRNPNKNLSANQSIKYDTKVPNFDITVLPTSSNKATISITNASHNYKLTGKTGNDNFNWGEHKIGSVNLKGYTIKDDYCGKYTIRATRTDITCLYLEKELEIDSVLPDVTNFIGYPVQEDGKRGKFSGNFTKFNTKLTDVNINKSVNYYVNGKKINTFKTNEVTLSSTSDVTLQSKSFDILSDTNKDYIIKFERTSNSNLYVTKTVKIDSRLPKVELIPYNDETDVLVSGSAATFKFKNISSDNLPVSNVLINYSDIVTNKVIQMKIPDVKDINTHTVTIPEEFDTEEIQLVPGCEYRINMTVDRIITNDVGNFTLRTTSNNLYFIAKGGIWIRINNKPTSGTVCIYRDAKKQYCEAVPYVFTGGRWDRTR